MYNCARYQWKNIVVGIPEPTALILPLTAPWQLTRLKIACVPYQWGDREDLQPPEWVMSHIWTSHVTHTNEPCHTYEWAMSHIWMSRVALMKKSHAWDGDKIACVPYQSGNRKDLQPPEWVMSHMWMRHVTYMNESCNMKSHATHMKESITYEGVKIAQW